MCLISLPISNCLWTDFLLFKLRVHMKSLMWPIIYSTLLSVDGWAKSEHLIVSVALANDIFEQWVFIRVIRLMTANDVRILLLANMLIWLPITANSDTFIGSLCDLQHVIVVLVVTHSSLCLKALPAVQCPEWFLELRHGHDWVVSSTHRKALKPGLTIDNGQNRF